ncbi:hypothetical protein F511_43971 [Dorcoceras hygrometricum]|uniref:Uncharacterized protein n=1 Tax=Dorcoceras hygrometricum TaxID=472368 RepID=A0A2Z7B3Z0_9LAMI|nr:hypothetical protein F511_43971 [Dorcoceras hygrometricum]
MVNPLVVEDLAMMTLKNDFEDRSQWEFSGTTDPFVAESWIKSMEVIFEYLQTPDIERSRCAIYMLRDDAMLWWEGAKLTVGVTSVRPDYGRNLFLVKSGSRCDDVSFAGMRCIDDISLAVEEVWSLVLFFLRSDEICFALTCRDLVLAYFVKA